MSKIRLIRSSKLLLILFILGISGANIVYSSHRTTSENINENVTLEYWQEFIQENPNYKDGYVEYGNELLKRGFASEANKAFDKARELERKY